MVVESEEYLKRAKGEVALATAKCGLEESLSLRVAVVGRVILDA